MEFRAFRDLLQETYHPDPERHCDALAERFVEFTPEQLEGFHDALQGLVDWLDVPELETAAALVEVWFGEEAFRAFRCRLVLALPQLWDAGLTNPDSLVPLADSGVWFCDRLATLAGDRHEALTGRRLRLRGEPYRLCSVGMPIETFAQQFPRFFRRYPWQLGLRAGIRVFDVLDARDPAADPRFGPRRARLALLGILVAVGLLLFSRPWFALVLGVASVGVLVFELRRSRRCPSRWLRQRRTRGGLKGRVPFRVVRAAVEGDGADGLHACTEAPDPSRWRTRLEEGLRWLEAEARRYGRDLAFVEVGAPIHRHCASDASLEQLLTDTEVEDDASFVLVVADVAGGIASRDRRVACVGARQPAGTYAHEVLHLFGAVDLYRSDRLMSLYGQALQAWLREVFADDFAPEQVSVMDDAGDPDACVDRFTARVVGWREPSAVGSV